MVTKRIFVVFILPVIFSLIFGSLVLNDILQKPDRNLNMWPMSSSDRILSHNDNNTQIEILGLSKQYTTVDPVEIQIKVNDSSFECGDLYITIYNSGENQPVTQSGFLTQCFEKNNQILPMDDDFSKVIDKPGSYYVVAEMVSKELKNISVRGTFTVK